jgi:hypothetical protein
MLSVVLLSGNALPAQSYIAAEDEAFYEAYADGWQSGQWSGQGFGVWKLFEPDFTEQRGDSEGAGEQFAGFFIADATEEGDLGAVARENRAFGIFANGTGFEETLAFRTFERVLGPGDVFSLRFKFDGFSDRFESDRAGISSVGVALHHQSDAQLIGDLARGRLAALAVIEGLSTYQILDRSGRFNTRVFIDPEGVEIGFRVRSDGRYDLQLTTLSERVVHHFDGRTFSPLSEELKGDAAATAVDVRSFAVFNLNGGDANAYFGTLQVSAQE